MKWIRFTLACLFLLAVSTAGLAGETGSTQQESPVVLSNAAGTESRMLPANMDVWTLDWSPDGKTVVFSGKMQGEPASKMRIWYWQLEPAQMPSLLTNTEGLIDSSPRWSPDGSQVVMTRRTFNSSSNLSSAIWLKDMRSGAGRQLTTGPQDRDPAWSPDGSQIVFTRDQGPYQSQLMIVGVNEKDVKVLAGNGQEILQSPWWSADGKIYFTRFTPRPKNVTVNGQTYQVMEYGPGSIWAIDPVTRAMEPVVQDRYDNRSPVLSPDGTKLAFISDRIISKEGNGKFDRGSLYIMDLATGQVTYLVNKVGLNGGSLSWSPDGKKLAFFTFRSIRPAVWVINVPET
ncbi:MAG TPA: hypothetical protein PLC07_07370 [Bacillota bacterium]|nr:hypothetical protein [Bacillota bacterium]